MRIVSAVIVAILMLWVDLHYCWLTIKGQTDPVFAGWLVLTVSVGLAFWTYWETDKHNLIDNIGNTVDLFGVLLIISTVVVFGKNMRAGFTSFEIGSLIFAGIVTIFWWLSKDSFTSNLAIQGLMVIGYFPLMARVANASVNPEPWSVWIPVWFACVFAMIPAYLPEQNNGDGPKTWKGTVIPKVYATRATILVTILLLLMLKAEIR